MLRASRLALAVAAAVAVIAVSRGARTPARTTPAGAAAAAARRVNVRLDELDRHEAVSPEHAARAREALVRFSELYARTWSLDAATPDAVRRLFGLRDAALGAIAELKMRLPNDLAADRELYGLLRHVERATQAAVDDVRTRAGTGLQSVPIGSAYDAYRAANDL